MTQEDQNSPEELEQSRSVPITQAAYDRAVAEENEAFQQGQIEYLKNRVANLRAALNIAADELKKYKAAESQKKAGSDPEQE